jgi:hypothetical protein
MYDILQQIPDKQLEFKDTTSRLWKKELHEFFKDLPSMNCLEIGTNHGWTSLWSSYFFNHVYTIEHTQNRYESAKKLCSERDNITFILGDAYKDSTYDVIKKPINAVIIDCIHEYDYVIRDINKALSFYNNEKIYLIFDDYGHPETTGVYDAIQQAIQTGLKVESYIGEPAGYVVNRTNGTSFQLMHREGIILSYE